MGASKEYKAVSNYLLNTLKIETLVQRILEKTLQQEIEKVFAGFRGQKLVTEAILKGLGKTEWNVDAKNTDPISQRFLIDRLNDLIGKIILTKLDIQVKPKNEGL